VAEDAVTGEVRFTAAARRELQVCGPRLNRPEQALNRPEQALNRPRP
jgi:hypothetical protein